jgi:hypothetical protein
LIRIPLTDLGSAEYFGFSGGLYPDGKNSRPAAHDELGVALGSTVQPLEGDGNRSSSGKIVMLCVGMSNASREFSRFTQLINADPRKNPNLVMIDAGRNGAAATDIALPLGSYWKHVDNQLERCDASAAQVQVVWLKTALAHHTADFPDKARFLQQALRSIVGILASRFAQLKLVYVSSRVYGGYSESDLSPEPIAYESGFAIKWLIEERINNSRFEGSVPWLGWGPYLWADGLTPRSDGLIWERNDFEPDGVHPSAQGAFKVATMLLDFFQNDTAAKPWFLNQ